MRSAALKYSGMLCLPVPELALVYASCSSIDPSISALTQPAVIAPRRAFSWADMKILAGAVPIAAVATLATWAYALAPLSPPREVLAGLLLAVATVWWFVALGVLAALRHVIRVLLYCMRRYCRRIGLMPGEFFDIVPFDGTPLALERGLADGTECWDTAPVAGLQFYEYGTHDELVGKVIPRPGDALTIMRRPDNRADPNACEVWWRNRFLLGHLPRYQAALLAPRLDRGEALRAYVFEPGWGVAWSLRIVLIGRACEDLHRERLAEMYGTESTDDPEDEDWCGNRFSGDPDNPDDIPF